jgi:hypothetical protein
VTPPLDASTEVAIGRGFPSGDSIAGPLDLFTTWIHEFSHAVVGVLVGRSIDRVDLSINGSGSTRLTSSGVPSDLGQIAIGSAGYVGTVVVGAVLLVLGRWVRASRIALGTLGVLLILSALLWMPSAFAFGLSFGLGVLFLVLTFILPDRWVRIAASVLGVVAIVEGLLRVADVGDTTTDAVLTASYGGTGVGTVKTVWVVVALGCALGAVVLRSRLASRSIPAPPPLNGSSLDGPSPPTP